MGAAGFLLLIGIYPSHIDAHDIDCPWRDDPFSMNLPLYDLIVNEAAATTVEQVGRIRLDELGQFLVDRTVPSFSTVVDVPTALQFAGRPALSIERRGKINEALMEIEDPRSQKFTVSRSW